MLLAAAFSEGMLQHLVSLDRGRGIYVSMLWLAPGFFVPWRRSTRLRCHQTWITVPMYSIGIGIHSVVRPAATERVCGGKRGSGGAGAA